MLKNPATVSVGRNYNKSLVQMTKMKSTKGRRFSAKYLLYKLIEEFFREGAAGAIAESQSKALATYEVVLPTKILRAVIVMARERALTPEALLRAIVENRVRDRRRQDHEAAVKK